MIRLVFIKELRAYFRSPISFVILGLFTLILGWIFYYQLVYFVDHVQKVPVAMRNHYDFANEVIIKLFGSVNYLLLFIIPILSMKVFSEEYKNETINLYFSSPISDYEFILGKYLALVTQGAVLIATTLIYPLFLGNLNLSDVSFIFCGYFGLLFNLMAYSALACLASSFSKNQIVAALSAFVFILFSWMVAMFSQMSSNFAVSQFLQFLSVNHHFENFVKANIALSDISFYFAFIIMVLMILKTRLDARRWL